MVYILPGESQWFPYKGETGPRVKEFTRTSFSWCYFVDNFLQYNYSFWWLVLIQLSYAIFRLSCAHQQSTRVLTNQNAASQLCQSKHLSVRLAMTAKCDFWYASVCHVKSTHSSRNTTYKAVLNRIDFPVPLTRRWPRCLSFFGNESQYAYRFGLLDIVLTGKAPRTCWGVLQT